MADVAVYTCAALHQQAAQSQTILVGGPELLSPGTISSPRSSKNALPVHHVPPGSPVRDLPEFITQLLTSLDSYDSPIDMTQTSRTFEIDPTDLVDFVDAMPTLPTTRSQAESGQPASTGDLYGLLACNA
jgi:hypothetical protein